MGKEVFDRLKAIHGSHKAAAEALGIHRKTLLNYRKGHIPKHMEQFIELWLKNHDEKNEDRRHKQMRSVS
jgi:hypothetical protein